MFEIASNWVFLSGVPNYVLTASDPCFPKAWIFDCEDQAARAAAKLNKATTKHRCISAVACIITHSRE